MQQQVAAPDVADWFQLVSLMLKFSTLVRTGGWTTAFNSHIETWQWARSA